MIVPHRGTTGVLCDDVKKQVMSAVVLIERLCCGAISSIKRRIAFPLMETPLQVMSIVLFTEHVDPRSQVLPALPDLTFNDRHGTVEILSR